MQNQVIQSQHQHRDIRLIGLEEVTARTTLCKAIIWERIKEGTFPAPVPVGKPYRDGRNSRVAWIEGEVVDWIMAQVQRARATA